MFNDKRRVTILMRLFSLTISLVLALPPLFGWGHFMPEENGMRYERIFVRYKNVNNQETFLAVHLPGSHLRTLDTTFSCSQLVSLLRSSSFSSLRCQF